jgi:hypothetical protein
VAHRFDSRGQDDDLRDRRADDLAASEFARIESQAKRKLRKVFAVHRAITSPPKEMQPERAPLSRRVVGRPGGALLAD